MKDQNKKLQQYTALATTVLGAGVANGQIVYTDIADTTIDTHKGYYDLDMDNDGSPDFRIQQYLDTGSTGLIDAIMVTPFDSLYGRTMGELENGFSYPFRLVPGDSIGLSSEWQGNTDEQRGYLVFQYNGTPYPNSNWKGPVNNGYLGLRIFKNTGFHFGWVRLDIAADNRSFIVKDFAYNSTGNEGMLAAEPTISIVERMLEDLTVGQSGTTLYLEKPESYGAIELRVLSMDGREMLTDTWVDTYQELSVSELRNQAILVEFTYRGVRHTKKILLLED
ncbi:hypothetical protein [Phaeocystidibacter luteus]|uniref:T9SS type A sorting domain-containing protein n=1 Tax=Phaeocystidibacter luteus TaxID=911197 RepID=A0A6N6RMU7_9FLAO|nr:hypothetical protein [Phaeocystidibacter luteus]KAB2814868.1 hypothetical protein F8C67_03715 [Phaeocystidibacter luteus]